MSEETLNDDKKYSDVFLCFILAGFQCTSFGGMSQFATQTVFVGCVKLCYNDKNVDYWLFSEDLQLYIQCQDS